MGEEKEPCSLQLSVTDDGIGLPADLQSGVGLISMRERAEELGGTCDVDSHQQRGTRISAVLPFTTRR